MLTLGEINVNKALSGKFLSTDKETGVKESMDVQEIKFRLMGRVKDVSMAINDMVINRNKVQTDFMIYEFIR